MQRHPAEITGKTRAEISEALTQSMARAAHAQSAAELQELKDRFALNWSVLSLTQAQTFEALSAQQSEFAAITINTALRLAWQDTAKRFRLSIPDNHPVNGLFVLGLGKLGGQDLNFSSDVDLIGFYDPETVPVPKTLGQAHICGKVLQAMTQILNPRNAPDFVWRVDWRLRPESSATGLAMSIHDAETFYFTRALPWHRLALMKAQIVGGDKAAGQAFLKTLIPFIWRQNLDFRAIDDLADLKTHINLEHPALRQERAQSEPITKDMRGFNVKLGRGGIREIEFIVNAQQLIWGGKEYRLRTTNTLNALQILSELGHMPAEDYTQLRKIYIGLRQLENAIQMRANEQTHIVPDEAEKIEILQHLLGLEDWAKYCAQIYAWRKTVNRIFEHLFNTKDTSETPPLLLGDKLSLPSRDIAQSWADGFSFHGINRNNLPVFKSLGQSLIQRVLDSQADTDTAFTRIDYFLKTLSRSEQYLHLLRRNPKLLDALITPLLHSPHMTELLRQSPHIIDVFLSAQSYVNTPKDIGAPNTDFVLAEDDYETRLERLRRFVNEHLFQYYHEFMHGADPLASLQSNLTRLAEITIDTSLQIVRDDLGLTHMPVAVLGLGKMGTQRMAPLSDIDLVFIFNDSIDEQLSAKIVRRLRTVLTSKLREGMAYELDMRLRPSGRSGPPAVKLSAFEKHHQERAKNWEHIALAHSRLVAGDKALGKKVEAICQKLLTRPRNHGQFLADAAIMWTRITEQRIADITPDIINAKLRPGGLMQAEYIDACNIILGRPRLTLPAIEFFSHQQIWERLLGLSGAPLSDIPERFRQAVFDGQRASLYQKTVGAHQRATIKATDAYFKDIEIAQDYVEGPIIWTD